MSRRDTQMHTCTVLFLSNTDLESPQFYCGETFGTPCTYARRTSPFVRTKKAKQCCQNSTALPLCACNKHTTNVVLSSRVHAHTLHNNAKACIPFAEYIMSNHTGSSTIGTLLRLCNAVHLSSLLLSPSLSPLSFSLSLQRRKAKLFF